VFVGAKARRVCAGGSNKSAVDHIFSLIETELCEFTDGEVHDMRLGDPHDPKISCASQVWRLPRFSGRYQAC
jgi:hypothetical protein